MKDPLHIPTPLFVALLAGIIAGSAAEPLQKKKPLPPPQPITRIAYVQGGYLWSAAPDGSQRKRVVRMEDSDQYGGDRNSIVIVRESSLWRYSLSTGKLIRMANQSRYVGVPTVVGDRALIAKTRASGDGDDGLWSVELSNGKSRRLKPAVDADLPVHYVHRVSPDRKRIASGGRNEGRMRIVVGPSNPSAKPTRHTLTIDDATDFDWLDSRSLLVGVTPADPQDPYSLGGVWQVDPVTEEKKRWAYGKSAAVQQVVGSPDRKWFAVGLGALLDTELTPVSARLELVEASTKRTVRVEAGAPVRICGFSADGARLYFLRQHRLGKSEDHFDLCAADLKTLQITDVVLNVASAAVLN